jgi:hypothetical protein
MNDATEGSASGSAAEPTPNGASPSPEGTNGTSNGNTSSGPAAAAAPSIVRDAILLFKQHPLGAVATVAAAAAFIEVELAVGILAGLGATAMLATESGPAARQRVLERGKWALARARSAMHTKPKAPPQEVPPPV